MDGDGEVSGGNRQNELDALMDAIADEISKKYDSGRLAEFLDEYEINYIVDRNHAYLGFILTFSREPKATLVCLNGFVTLTLANDEREIVAMLDEKIAREMDEIMRESYEEGF